jgi:excisionase family DNA binding protein
MSQTPLSVSKAAKMFGVHCKTIREWADNGKLKHIRTPTGQRRIILEEENQEVKKRIIYCRVSSPKQKDDLERQIQYLKTLYPGYEIVKDVGSGINFQRKGLLSLLDLCLRGMVSEVVVASKDRLCRFAFELLEWLFQREKVKLTILEQNDLSPEQELSNDVLSIIQVFRCRRNGKRRYKGGENEAQNCQKNQEIV